MNAFWKFVGVEDDEEASDDEESEDEESEDEEDEEEEEEEEEDHEEEEEQGTYIYVYVELCTISLVSVPSRFLCS